MKVTAVIAEYNPLHNGHVYQLLEIRRQTGADFIVVLLSGDFVQRGTPAILDKYARTQAALQSGADLVLELPVLFATANGDDFAHGAVRILDGLCCIDALCFGCEDADLPVLRDIATVLADEPADYVNARSDALSHGVSFPAARATGVAAYFANTGADPAPYETILRQPNNILALSYLQALRKQNSAIKPVAISRIGAGYHTTDISGTYPSASGLRALLYEHPQADISHGIPEAMQDLLRPAQKNNAFVTPEDVSDVLRYRLLSADAVMLSRYTDGNEDFARRICHLRHEATSFDAFCSALKNKSLTHAQIRRALLHLILDLPCNLRNAAFADETAYYGRILGFRKEASALLARLHKTSQIPLVTKLATDEKDLSLLAKTLLEKDVFAAEFYAGMQGAKLSQPLPNEYRRGVLTI